MAVFTAVTLDDLTQWMKQFPLGQAVALKGIASGIENSNFFLTTQRGAERAEYVLTVFENLDFDQLPFYLQLMRHLAERGIPVPAPVPNAVGDLVVPLHGKPAAIVSKLEGSSQMDPQPVHCAEVGTMLARMHLAASDFPMQQPNLRGLAWWQATTPLVLPYLTPANACFLHDEVTFQTEFAASPVYAQLPRGPVHADLFRNNVMFVGEKLTGCFDFYFAGVDTWLFDLAVTVNDWCIDLDSGELDEARVNALLASYRAVRPFTDAEDIAWQPMLRAAALRFWLSRLYDFYVPREAEMLTPHDPTHFERILRERIATPAPRLANFE
ncbi:homoserine kinase [Massilia litorea]|jgi:homoserine kinase type II|uniref:Homoserine kinase n=1 Tax=Massilia litorea TaxID=2769491 RepID=A0A7L9U4V7_9BURK|nr:homoserine kinase [Massilia litorea]QOL50103.1 homoserine kinase [Massilia litorea]